MFPPRPSMRLVRDTITFAAAEMPRWHSISISGYHIREAGSTAAQELAFTLANGFAYVELALQAGLAVDAFAPRLSFFFNAHIDFFEEIAKYRAARRIWARWMQGPLRRRRPARRCSCGSTPRPPGVSLTAQQPEVNIARTAIEALAGVLGGTQSLHTNSMDEALALPDREGGPHRAAHPAGDRLRDRRRPRRRSARRLLVRRGAHRRDGAAGRGDLRPPRRAGRRLDARGRLSPGIDDGWFQGEIADAAYDLERKLNDGRRIVVGVNRLHRGQRGRTPRPPRRSPNEERPADQAARPGPRRSRPGRRSTPRWPTLRAEAADPSATSCRR